MLVVSFMKSLKLAFYGAYMGTNPQLSQALNHLLFLALYMHFL